MATSLDPQLALDERAINDPDLEKALERRLRAGDDVAEARGVFKTADAEVKAAIEKIADFGVDEALRVGRFRITKRHVEGGLVEFERKSSDQLRIGLVDEDGNATRRSSGPKRASVSDDEDLRPKGTGQRRRPAARRRGALGADADPPPERPAARLARQLVVAPPRAGRRARAHGEPLRLPYRVAAPDPDSAVDEAKRVARGEGWVVRTVATVRPATYGGEFVVTLVCRRG